MDFENLSESEWQRVDGIWDLIDDGQLDAARVELAALLSARPGHPDLRIVEATLALEEGEPRAAMSALRGAERSADPAVFFHLRGLARYDLLEFDEALRDGERALAVRPDMAEAHDLMSRACEHLGNPEEAQSHAEEAFAMDPENFPMPLEMADDEFDALVERSVRELPPAVRKELDEIPVMIESLPYREMLQDGDDEPLGPDLLGLFVGRHLLERSHQDLPSPGAIFLFRRNLLRACHDRDELVKEIRVTVQHEVGHLLGLDEDDLDRWGLA
jgi:predicted Zn-dependent protease with MMP-like domain